MKLKVLQWQWVCDRCHECTSQYYDDVMDLWISSMLQYNSHHFLIAILLNFLDIIYRRVMWCLNYFRNPQLIWPGASLYTYVFQFHQWLLAVSDQSWWKQNDELFPAVQLSSCNISDNYSWSMWNHRKYSVSARILSFWRVTSQNSTYGQKTSLSTNTGFHTYLFL